MSTEFRAPGHYKLRVHTDIPDIELLENEFREIRIPGQQVPKQQVIGLTVPELQDPPTEKFVKQDSKFLDNKLEVPQTNKIS